MNSCRQTSFNVNVLTIQNNKLRWFDNMEGMDDKGNRGESRLRRKWMNYKKGVSVVDFAKACEEQGICWYGWRLLHSSF